MGPLRFERRTSRLSAERSTWLSYGPETIANITPCNLNLVFVPTVMYKTFLSVRVVLIDKLEKKRKFTMQPSVWAGSSGVDRSLGMGEASGSNPDRSILLLIKYLERFNKMLGKA
jgi:hypothetical protein